MSKAMHRTTLEIAPELWDKVVAKVGYGHTSAYIRELIKKDMEQTKGGKKA